jgi:hypothetical protein
LWAERFSRNPIIVPEMSRRLGTNINGPSLIRVPEWVERPLGRYYLYFSHHRGAYLRLAYADDLAGPWTIYEPGVLDLQDSYCMDHVASPDVHVDDAQRRFRIYYHGAIDPARTQATLGAVSHDGLDFRASPEVLGVAYFRCFNWDGCVYAMARPGIVYRSRDGLSGFERGPLVTGFGIGAHHGYRHGAVKLDGNVLTVFYSTSGDCPERILASTVELTPDWTTWRASPAQVMLEPELPYETAGLPRVASKGGWAPEPVCELRDPGIYREDGRDYLLYSVAGEQGIAIAELHGGTAP